MKKIPGSVVALILFIIVFSRVQPVYAGIAVHATAKYGTSISIELNPVPSNKFGHIDAGQIIPWAGLLDEAMKAGYIAIPDIAPYAAFNQKVSDKITPDSIKQNIVNFTNANPVSAKYCIRVVIKPPRMNVLPDKYNLTVTTTEISEDWSHDWQDAKIAGQNEEMLASAMGLWKKPANDSGLYDYNYPTHVVADITTGDCDFQDQGNPVPHTALSVRSYASFPDGCPDFDHCGYRYEDWYQGPKVQEWVEVGNNPPHMELRFVHEPVVYRFDLTRKSVDSQFTNLQAKTGRCDPSSTSDPETAKLCEERGQWPSYFVPGKIFDQPIQPNALVPQGVALTAQSGNGRIAYIPPEKVLTLDTAFKNTNSAMEDTKTAVCFTVPAQLQDKLAIGVPDHKVPFSQNCNTSPIVGNCPIDLIEQGQGKNVPACNLASTGGYTSLPFVNVTVPGKTYKFSDALPNGVPPLMQKVLDAAGAAYNVPASVLLGTMLEEGAFNHHGTWDWTDDTVKKFSDCTSSQPMPQCTGEGFVSSSGAKGPFGYIQYWWDKYMGTGGPYKTMVTDPIWKKVVGAIPQANITPCNFTDAAFMAARELGEDQSHYQPAYVPPAPLQCTVDGHTYNTNIPTLPASCSDWNSDRVALARLQYDDRACDSQITRMVTTANNY